jgi:uncharacterized protein with gpF-like domain
MRKEIVDLINEEQITNNVEFVVLNELNNYYQKWKDLLLDLYLNVGGEFSKVTIAQLKNSNPSEVKLLGDDWEDFVRDYLENQSSQKIVKISDTTRQQIMSTLSEGLVAGEGIGELAKRIDDLFIQHIIPRRSEVIARTEVIAASNLGSYAGAKSTGLELNKMWISTIDKRTRIDPFNHLAMMGVTVPMDEPFVVSGEKLMFPGDISLGATAGNVIQCRCTIGYQRIRETA